MISIQILQSIKHDGQQYHAGELRIVDERLGGYFCGNGWAKEPDADGVTTDLTPKTLDVQNGKHGHASTGVK